MSERDFEQMVERLMKQDFSTGTDQFREALLESCLSELRANSEIAEVDDDDLELLAAAGPGYLYIPPTLNQNVSFGDNTAR